ncbi:hypothetical protein KFL_000380220 [Klebsormidium nitens]|uniref:Uncharacterized protein n=1 Tax=Klebsormidium nitens TaxID=105231 RepID=A0A1Y1HVC5_KLENI|nr:hypothetical protein KFL_000380220 [Klebsormidium nitens]|eukprot:GAQ79788.1 hypothetical protein KFL_000380220 [Klebsormidium nitens]
MVVRGGLGCGAAQEEDDSRSLNVGEHPQAQAQEEVEGGESRSESPLALSKRNAPVAEKKALISAELERRQLSELQEVLIVRAE